MKFIDITGNKYNRLTVLKRSHNNKFNYIVWLCSCDCGKTTFAMANELKIGAKKSCGCLNNEMRLDRITTHGLSKKPIYKVWKGMRARCNRVSDKRYLRYGGRGITICNEWQNPEIFYSWAVSNGYKAGLTIDRENNNGNYEPSNCRFIPLKENNRNSSNCKVDYKIVEKIKSTYTKGVTRQEDIAKEFGITQQTVSKIINLKTWN